MGFVVDRETGRVAATYVGNTPLNTPCRGHGTDAGADLDECSRGRAATTAGEACGRTPPLGANGCKTGCRIPLLCPCRVAHDRRRRSLLGVYDETDTDYVDVPGWEYGNFVTNEVWASASTLRGVPNTWTEFTGQIAGAYKSCCSVWWFYAFQNGTEGFRAFEEAPYTWEVRQAVGNNYGMKTTGGGVWCWYDAADWTLEACAADFAWVATELEAGGEIGSEEKPVFDASTNNSAEWMNGEWHTGTALPMELPMIAVVKPPGYVGRPSTALQVISITTLAGNEMILLLLIVTVLGGGGPGVGAAVEIVGKRLSRSRCIAARRPEWSRDRSETEQLRVRLRPGLYTVVATLYDQPPRPDFCEAAAIDVQRERDARTKRLSMSCSVP